MDAQNVFAILVGGALACFSLVMVGYSFLRGSETRETDANVETPEEDGVGIDAILDSIDTLELEYQLGNIPEDQYLQQMQSYRLQVAMSVKEQLERGDASPELLLEQEVLRARTEGVGSWQSCPQCDAPLPKSTETDAPLAICPHCNAALAPENSAFEPGNAALAPENPVSARDASGGAFPAQGE